MPKPLTAQQKELIEWELMDKATRAFQRLPATLSEWAEWKGIAERTVYRWKSKPEYQEEFQRRKLAVIRAAPGSTLPGSDAGEAEFPPSDESGTPDIPEMMTDEEAEFREIRRAVVALARQGKKEGIDAWAKWFGKSILEDQIGDTSRLLDLSDAALAREVVEMLGVDAVTRAIAELTARESDGAFA